MKRPEPEQRPIFRLYAPGTVCGLTDVGLHFAPGEAGARFVVSAITKDGLVACRKEPGGAAYTLPPKCLRPLQ